MSDNIHPLAAPKDTKETEPKKERNENCTRDTVDNSAYDLGEALVAGLQTLCLVGQQPLVGEHGAVGGVDGPAHLGECGRRHPLWLAVLVPVHPLEQTRLDADLQVHVSETCNAIPLFEVFDNILVT